jgi:hypothetical protein
MCRLRNRNIRKASTILRRASLMGSSRRLTEKPQPASCSAFYPSFASEF